MRDELVACFRSHPGVDVDMQALKSPRGPMRDQIQLYYSFSDIVADPKLQPMRYIQPTLP